MWALDDRARSIVQRYEIESWVGINQVVSISWESWLSMDYLLKRAIAMQVEEVNRVRQNQAREQQQKLDNMLATQGTQLKFNTPARPIQDLFK